MANHGAGYISRSEARSLAGGGEGGGGGRLGVEARQGERASGPGETGKNQVSYLVTSQL